MNKRSIASLYGYIRLAPTQDCVGIAVFRESGMNFDLIAEMDSDLRITRFLDFLPEQGYQVESLPRPERRRYSIGDAAPIPFLTNGVPVVISGDRHPRDVNAAVPNNVQSDVIQSVKALLTNARAGFFRQKLEDWKIEEVRSVYADVLSERPNRSRYWVTRYRSAITRSKGDSGLPAALADDYRRVGMHWLRLFGTKTEFSRMRLLFGPLDDGVFNENDLISSAFALLSHKYANRDFRFLKHVSQDPFFLGLFPGGLYYHFLQHGYPNAPFGYEKPSDFLSELRRELFQASETYRLKEARSHALILFGGKDPPFGIQDHIARLRVRLTQDFNSGKEEEARKVPSFRYVGGRYVPANDDLPEYVSLLVKIVTSFDALADLECIEYGDARLAPRNDDFLAAERPYVEGLRALLT
jgi:hypothetical protein